MDKAVTNEQDLKQAQIKKRFGRKDKIETLRWIMSCPMGRSFIWWRLEEARIFSSTMGPDREMCHSEGKRFMGLQLFELIQGDEDCREKFREAQRENTRKVQEDTNG